MQPKIGIIVAAAALAFAPGLVRANPTFMTIHPFGGPPNDGEQPTKALIFHSGKIYGTTCRGGTQSQGTIFRMTVTGGETLMHNMNLPVDGFCASELTFHQGMFYGTTPDGGTEGGTIFDISPVGPNYQYNVLHDFVFNVSPFGDSPRAGLLFHNGAFYGTALAGANADGQVYKFITSPPSLVHDFDTTMGDGAYPKSGLIFAGGALYGTTTAGTGPTLLGTVFKMTLGGTIAWQHDFAGGTDGDTPGSVLLKVGNHLYGTTRAGGTGPSPGNGTLYQIDITIPAAPVYSQVYQFLGGTSDGQTPSGNLATLGGLLYGTAEAGGTGNGTIFAVDPVAMTGLQQWPLNGTTEGAVPMSGLVLKNGWFYGAASGGSGSTQFGTIFKFHL
jgi:uncharacterized repeat protein (TIGR03803 family)